MCGHAGENCVQRANSQRMVRGDGDAVRRRFLSLLDDLASDLMDSGISPVLAEVLDQVLSAEIARQLHATARTSSRTSRRRMEAGGWESK